MIVNIELQDTLTAQQEPTKLLVISYVDTDHRIKFLKYTIPTSQLYNWYYYRRPTGGEQGVLSWDNKHVKKVYCKPEKIYLSETRIREIMFDLCRMNPAVDKALNTPNIPDTSYCDIETLVTDDGFCEPTDAKNPVTTISWCHDDEIIVFGVADLSKEQIACIQKDIDKHCEKFKTNYRFIYKYYETEFLMLQDFFYNYFAKADCVTGWNFFGYDYLYLYTRAGRIGLDISCIAPTNSWYNYKLFKQEEKVRLPMHKMIYDYMEIFQKWDQSISPKENTKLDWVGEQACGVQKVYHQMGLKELWEKDKQHYVFYNAVDSILVREIDLKIKTSQTLFSLCTIMKTAGLDCMSPVRSITAVQTDYLYKDGKIFTADKRPEIEKQDYEGAYVYEPVPGIYRNVIALDFASLYPTTMRQFNMSPDTYLGKKPKNYVPAANEIKTVTGVIFKRDEVGFMNKILTAFYNQRKAYKKEMKVATQEKYDLIAILERREREAAAL